MIVYWLKNFGVAGLTLFGFYVFFLLIYVLF